MTINKEFSRSPSNLQKVRNIFLAVMLALPHLRSNFPGTSTSPENCQLNHLFSPLKIDQPASVGTLPNNHFVIMRNEFNVGLYLVEEPPVDIQDINPTNSVKLIDRPLPGLGRTLQIRADFEIRELPVPVGLRLEVLVTNCQEQFFFADFLHFPITVNNQFGI